MDYKSDRKPIAVIGNGPCLSDLKDRERLLEERWCIALNGTNELLHTQAVMLQTFQALVKFWTTVRDDQYLILGFSATAISLGLRNKTAKENMELHEWLKTREFEEFSIRGFNCDASACQASAYAERHGHETVELYGVDLNEPKYKDSRQAAALLKEWCKIKIINCCPSTQCSCWPIESRPWTQ